MQDGKSTLSDLLDIRRVGCIFVAAKRFAVQKVNQMMHEMKVRLKPLWSSRAPLAVLILAIATSTWGQTNSTATSGNAPGWITEPLSLVDALNLTLKQNSTIQKAQADLESQRGLVIQTRAIALPSLAATANATRNDQALIQNFPFSSGPTNGFQPILTPRDSWSSAITLTQTIYQGGRTLSALRAAQLTKDQAVLNYETTVADTLLATRTNYYGVLLAEQQITVNEASTNLLTKQLEDQQRRYDAGTVPRFNVLQAEVALDNAIPPVINARNTYRIAKNNLCNQLGFNLPRDVWEDIPLRLTDKLDSDPYDIELPTAIAEALQKRTELQALKKTEALQRENIINAKAGYKPTISAFAGWDWRSSQFEPDPNNKTEYDGWQVGGQFSWSIFDGALTRGKIIQAKAGLEHARADVEDRARQIELEVRTDYSSFINAREVLQSQLKVEEEAVEALRLANARADAGTGTQLDVLNAQTQLTQARTTEVQALHDYDVARARLRRAIGEELPPPDNK
jgi:TolC family type I secretion outer membrane protein